MNKIASFLFSTRLMATLFLLFGAAMGIGTFIEDAYNTETARVFIYNTWWFEGIMVVFLINFLGNIKKYQLHKREKWATLMLHLAFILILIGAFVTRYLSYEGMMPIREKATEHQFYSDKPYLTVWVDGEYQGQVMRRTYEKTILMTSREMPLLASNHFSIDDEFNNIPFEIEYKNYVLGAKENIVPDTNGTEYLKLVEQSQGKRADHYLKAGEVQNINNILFAFNKPTAGAINITKNGEDYTLSAPFEGSFMRMADRMQGKVAKDTVQPLMFRSLYNVAGAMFVLPERAIKGKVDYVFNGDYKTKDESALTLTVKTQDEEKEVTLMGGNQKIGVPVAFKIGKLDFTLLYGSKTYELPFDVTLNDFIANRYPGMEGMSAGYSSFESKVTINDNEKKDKFDYHIYMNHVLDYRGYRFFQSGFDPDELGTKLSVSHDFWGTWLSYAGYFFLYLGLLAILFDKNTRFGDLKRKIGKIREKKAALTAMLVLFFALGGYAQTHNHEHDHAHEENHQHERPTDKQLDSIFKKYEISKEHAAKFGRILIQDNGRIMPVNTFSSELLRKLNKKETFHGMNSDQVLLSMALMDRMWYEVPVIYLARGNDSLRKITGLPLDAKYAAMSDFFDDKGNYKLSAVLEEGAHKKEMNKFDTDFKDINERVVLLNLTLSGQLFKVLPVPGNKNHKWVSYTEAVTDSIKGMDTIRNIVPYYFGSLGGAVQTGGYKAADDILDNLSLYQKKMGAEVMPSETKIDAELLYNKVNIFERLLYYYMCVGILMLLCAVIKIFYDKKWLDKSARVFNWIIVVLFLLHTAGLILRWYLSGHAPWSNAYESIVYVAWATMLFGLIFGRKSQLTVAAAAFVVSMVLFSAHSNWTDPAIANLQPVLNSYWLMIHVAIIVGCYGPFTLGMILGLVSLILMLFATEKNKKKLDLNIKELGYVNEMVLTVGLVMLTIGNFLGGQWANESWGRYWGWDPKETWAMVSIMVYAFVIHMRFVPKLRGTWIFSLFSALAYFSILMTYFGVNFYLTGLHSYATGEPRTPAQFYYMAAGMLILGGFAYWRYKAVLKKK